MKIKGRMVEDTVKAHTQHLIESPLDRATSFAQRTADERAEQTSQFFGNPGSSTS
jgi:hypothetical protein